MIQLRSQGSKLEQFDILLFKFSFGNNHIDTRRDIGCLPVSKDINHINCCDYILDEVLKKLDMRSFVVRVSVTHEAFFINLLCKYAWSLSKRKKRTKRLN